MWEPGEEDYSQERPEPRSLEEATILFYKDVIDGKPVKWAIPYLQNEDWHLTYVRTVKRYAPKFYYYMVTFTLDPKLNDITPELADKAYKYIIKHLDHKQFDQIIEFHIVREQHENGNPHWHVALKSHVYVKQTWFKHYIKLYGNVDVSKNKGGKMETMLEYLNKENSSTQLK